MVAVQPLFPPDDDPNEDPEEARKRPPPEIVGALIVEKFDDDRADEAFRERLRIVATHSGSALGNAREHDGLFLMPVWRAIGKSRWLIQARTLPKTILVLLGVLIVTIGMCVVPWKFQLKGRGVLQPVVRREVFAHVESLEVGRATVMSPAEATIIDPDDPRSPYSLAA